jgi:AcrR family transcriptional regulator
MSIPPDRRTRKRQATRQRISDAATRLFMEHGFDHVTVDQIAAAADVGRMTVFNHFPRKEDMLFDRDEEGRALLREAILEKDAGAPVESLRRLMHRLVDGDTPYARFTPASARFIATVEASAALKARARQIRGELEDVMATAMRERGGLAGDDPVAQLAAGMTVAALTVALVAAHRLYREGQDSDAAGALFLALVDRGCAGVAAALAGTAYA